MLKLGSYFKINSTTFKVLESDEFNTKCIVKSGKEFNFPTEHLVKEVIRTSIENQTEKIEGNYFVHKTEIYPILISENKENVNYVSCIRLIDNVHFEMRKCNVSKFYMAVSKSKALAIASTLAKFKGKSYHCIYCSDKVTEKVVSFLNLRQHAMEEKYKGKVICPDCQKKLFGDTLSHIRPVANNK